jgi:uncharacterized membrane protein (UPF0127 family)
VARVEVAADPEARQRGLMHRVALAPDCGMLFVYPDEAPRSFWMQGTLIPLAAAFLDGSGRVLNIEEMAPPAPGEARARTWSSAAPARFVLEMEAGWFSRKGVRPGDRIDLDAALRGVTPR